ncbi:MAG TPA: pyridoxamine 5'-phosphate oxidase family protein [Polyangia bacterium]
MAQGDPAARADLVRFLQRQRYGVVASLAAGGAAQSAVVGIATGETGEIVFDTLGTSRKARNLRRDARVSLVDGRDRLAWPHLTHFRMVPTWARSSDFAAAPAPLIVELDFPGRV